MVKKKAKRCLSLFLSFVMVLSLVVTPVYAEDESQSSQTTSASETGEDASSEDTEEADANSSISLASEEDDDGSEENASEETTTYVATIGENNYATLAEAVGAAGDEDTITVTGTVSESSTVITVTEKAITIDLNGQSVAVSCIIAYTNATVTIQDSTASVSVSKDGEYTVTYSGGCLSSSGNAVEAQNGGKAVLESGMVSGKYGLRAWGDTTGTDEITSTVEVKGGYVYAQECAVTAQGNGATVNISGGVMETADNAVVAGNGSTGQGGTTITISGGTLIGHIETSGYVACGIYHPQSGTLNISGGTIYVDGGCGILMRGGTLNMSGGTIIATEATNSGLTDGAGKVGDSRVVVTASGIVYDLDCGYYDAANVDINLSGNVSVTAAVSAIDVVDTSSAASENAVSVTGGTYSSDVSDYVDTSSYTVVKNSDGTYGLVEGSVVAAIGSNYYETLDEAFSNVDDGDTITLLKNVTTEDATYKGSGLYQVSGKEVTLDLNGKTLSVDTTRVFGVLDGGSLTVIDGTVKIIEAGDYTQFNILRGTCSFTAEDVTFDGGDIASNFLHVASDGVATVSLTNCDINNMAGGQVVYDTDGKSAVTLTGCNYAIKPVYCPAGNGVDKYIIVFNENNIIDEDTHTNNYEYTSTLYYNYVVADGGSITRDTTLTMSTTYGTPSLTVKDGGSVTANVTVAAGTGMTVSGGTVTGNITVKGESGETAAGSLSVSGGNVYGRITTSGTFTMTGGSVTNTDNTATETIMVNGGTVKISGGTVTNNATGTSYARAIVFASSGTITGEISGGTFTGEGDAALLARANESNTLTITGGTYTATCGLYLLQDLLASGYGVYNTEGIAVTANSSSQYKSTLDDKTVVVSSGVAQIGSTTYGTLAAAINAATDDDTVILLADVALESSVIVSGKSITLDLNGMSITRADGNTTSYLIGVDSDASLTVQDSETDGSIDGATYTLNGSTYVGYSILTNGTLILESGTLKGYYGVSVSGSSASFTVNGGTVSGTARGVSASTGTVTVSGGTVESTGTGSSCIGIFMNNGTVTVSGGTVKCAGGNAIKIQGGTLNVSGGTVDSSSGSSAYGITAIGYNDEVVVNLTGGTVKSACVGVYVWEYTCSATINVSKSATVEVSAEAADSWVYGIYLTAGAAANVEGGSITATNSGENGASAGIVYIGNGDSTEPTTVTISGGSISGGTYGLSGNGSASYSEVTISGGTISGGVVGIYHPEMGDLTISGGTITGKTSGVQLIAGSLTVTGGTITATATSAEIEADANNVSTKTGDGAIADGAAISIINRSGYGNTQSGGTVSYDSVTISGGTITSATGVDAVQAYDYNSSTGYSTISAEAAALINISGGNFSTVVKLAYCADGYTSETVADEEGYYTVTNSTYVAVAYMNASTDSTYYNYSTFDEAVAAIDDGTITDGMTIKLLSDATWTLTANKKITIGLTFDLNGKTLTLSGSYYVQFSPSSSTSTVAFIDSSYTSGELTGKVVGTYNGTYGMVRISKSCTVKLENVLFENSGYGYAVEIGTSGGQAIDLTAENCSFINSNTENKGNSTTTTLYSRAMLLYGNSASATGTLSFKNCTFETSEASNSGAALWISNGKSGTASVIEIDSCTIAGNGTTTSSFALNLSTSLNSKLTVTNSVISAPNGACAVFFNYSITSTADITFGDGNTVTGQVRFGNASSPVYLINVTGGCFSYTVDDAEEVPFVAATATESAVSVVNLLNLTGGYFKTDVSDVVASGYACVANTDEAAGDNYNADYAEDGYTYTVIEATDSTSFYVKASDGSITYYDTLSEALEASNSSSTVYFAEDCTLTDSDIATINSKGCTLTNYGSATLTYEGTLVALVSGLTAGTVEVSTLVYQYSDSVNHTMTKVTIASGSLTSGYFQDMVFNNSTMLSYYTADGLLTEDYVLCYGSYGWQVGSATDAYVAKVDDKAYFAKIGNAMTLAGGLNDSDGEAHTVTLLTNVTYDVEMSAATAGRKLILDLGGYTLTGHVYLLANNLTVTIKNGTISESDSSAFAVCTNGSYTGVSLTLNGVTVTNTEGYAMYLPADGTTTITNCTITSAFGIEVRAGTLNVTDSTVIATSDEFGTESNGSGTTVYGAGIAISQHTTNKEITVNIVDSKISGYYGVYEINYNSSNTSVVTVNISEETTDATVIKATGSDAAAVYSVSVSGTEDEDITATTNSITTISISGGHFSTDLANTTEYIAEGYAAYTETDTTTYAGKLYTVSTAVASITVDDETTYYATLDAALAAAEDGQTITLLADVSVTEEITISKSVTLDLNGNDFTVGTSTDTDPVELTIAEGKTVSIVDSSTGATGIVYNYGSITVNGSLDISTLGYTTDEAIGGLMAQTSGKISIGAVGTFTVPSVWATLWSWDPNMTSATSGSGIFSAAEVGATVVCNSTIWTCTTEFASESYDSNTTYWTQKTDFAKFYTRTLTLDGSIGMNYYVNPNGAADMGNYSVRFTVDGVVTTVSYDENSYRTDFGSGDTTYYRFTVYVTSVQMATNFTAELLYKGTVIQSNTCSVQEYCEYMIKNSSNENLKNLCVALLNYGGYAQTYFNENTDSLANKNLSNLISNWSDPVLNSWDNSYVSTYEAEVSDTLPSEIITVNDYRCSVTLLMESQTVMRIYFNASDTNTLTFTVNDVDLEIKTTATGDTGYGKYSNYVEFEVPANNLSTEYTINVSGSNADEAGTITCSALAYVNNRVTKSENDDLKNVCKALYYYSVAADAYSGWQ